ncbi:MAG: tRNA uridine-5-carboxymethylaminomethyl(34) synthesis GTPase MnmE [Rhodospirillaceae bacterium]|mgnify:CR=1 FL=1|nr:tRNA uridine-5-carboxymethylaminomethyl(34) synthesis GTPase MnmE [Rhodospirillaceae bacterium]|tara:strand:+ start:25552 stop:26886 length:1335 start_codon:yes stop_codon:yes gene_type:complete
MNSDTIFAPSSGGVPAGIAIIRISGERAGEILKLLAGGDLPNPRYAKRVTLCRPGDKVFLDEGLVIWFPGPDSFTGENVAELHVHGGRATVEAICSVLSDCEGCRLAEPGEFSRRAFENEKLDLAEIEGLADLIAAETEAQRIQALGQLAGGLSEIYEGWRESLLHLLAQTEAAIDFPEEDLPENLIEQSKHQMLGISDSITHYMLDNRRGERTRAGFQIAIIGPPNVGKSSVLNCLAERDVAIVSEEEGTTRDIVEVRLDLGGYPVTIADTAGVRSTKDEIEAEGVRRAKNRAEQADLRVLILDAQDPEADKDVIGIVGPEDIVLLNKIDLVEEIDLTTPIAGRSPLGISAKTGAEFDVFVKVLAERAGQFLDHSGPPPLTRLRHREALQECCDTLRRGLSADAAELMAEDLRLATRALGRITGRVDVEEVLGVIFDEFCIGK